MISTWTAYHGIRDKGVDPKTFEFGDLKSNPEGIHLGSLAQAKMRAGGGTVLQIKVHGPMFGCQKIKRVKDRPGSWKDTNKRARREGVSALVYLNRWEGITRASVERVVDMGADKFDRMPDTKVRNMAPELEDSWIILDPQVVSIERILSNEDVAEMLLNDAAEPSTAPQP